MKVLDEHQTVDLLLAGRSIARYGEGELRLAFKRWNLKSQTYDPRLAVELLNGLRDPGKTVIALPRLWNGMPNERFWRQFQSSLYDKHLRRDEYGSAFISRPDMVRAIDTADYWSKVRQVWANKNIVLVGPSPKVLQTPEAAEIRFVKGPAINAYAEINRIEEEIGQPSGPVLICLGATATVLALRLAKKGVQALDLGHLGAFMKSAGAFAMNRQALISDEYLEQNKILHKVEKFGHKGYKLCSDVLDYAKKVDANGILDYGCGQGTLKTALRAAGYDRFIGEYDPAIKGKDQLPKPVDLVACTDVLEHIEPDKLDVVLGHIHGLALKAAFLTIATRPAKKTLPDGRNAHLIQRPPAFWSGKVENVGFTIERTDIIPDHSVKFWCVRD